MAPPPGRRRSRKSTSLSTMNFEAPDSVDANPSEALTSQIASSILQEKYGVRSTTSAPPKVQEAVRRCLQDVSRTVQTEHPQWDLPKYTAEDSRSSASCSSLPLSNSGHRRGRAGILVSEEEDDPFLYDTRSQHGSLDFRLKKPDQSTRRMKAKVQGGIQSYPCPFRRRDPILFNIRDHENCAKRSFPDILELKYVPSYTGIRKWRQISETNLN